MNRKVLFPLLISYVFFFKITYAQDSLNNVSSVLKFNPFELIGSTFMMEYEWFNKSANKSFSIGLGLTYAEYDDYQDFEEVIGFKGELIKRFYIKKISPEVSKKNRNYLSGMYGGVFLRGGYEETQTDYIDYTYVEVDDIYIETIESNTRSGSWFFPGVMLGYCRTYWDKLFMDAYVGGGVKMVMDENSNPDFPNYYSYYHISPLGNAGVTANIGIKLGILIP